VGIGTVVEVVVDGALVVEDEGVVVALVDVEDSGETAVLGVGADVAAVAGADDDVDEEPLDVAGGPVVFGRDTLGEASPLITGSGSRLKAHAQPAVALAPTTPAIRARNRRRVRSEELIPHA
jgi:hypothetical protein